MPLNCFPWHTPTATGDAVSSISVCGHYASSHFSRRLPCGLHFTASVHVVGPNFLGSLNTRQIALDLICMKNSSLHSSPPNAPRKVLSGVSKSATVTALHATQPLKSLFETPNPNRDPWLALAELHLVRHVSDGRGLRSTASRVDKVQSRVPMYQQATAFVAI